MQNNIDKLIREKEIRDGKRINITDLAKIVYPNSSRTSAFQRFFNLRTGKTKNVSIKTINTLTTFFGCTYNEIFKTNNK